LREPTTAVLPRADVGKDDYDTAAPRHLEAEPLEALDAEGRLDLVRAQADHLCGLHPVAGVGTE